MKWMFDHFEFIDTIDTTKMKYKMKMNNGIEYRDWRRSLLSFCYFNSNATNVWIAWICIRNVNLKANGIQNEWKWECVWLQHSESVSVSFFSLFLPFVLTFVYFFYFVLINWQWKCGAAFNNNCCCFMFLRLVTLVSFISSHFCCCNSFAFQ